MKKLFITVLWIFLGVCGYFAVAGGIKAALMKELTTKGMMLQSDTANTGNLAAKVYEIAYSLPGVSEPVGRFAEALLASRYETFSSQSEMLSPALVKKLQNWPLNYTTEIDLSGSETQPEVLQSLGELSQAEWIDLSRTGVDAPSLLVILESAPKLEKLQLNKTNIVWDSDLVEKVLAYPNLKKMELDADSIDPVNLQRLQSVLGERWNNL